MAALPGQPDHLPRPDAGRDADLELAPVHLDALLAARVGQLQRDRQLRAGVAGRLGTTPRPRTAAKQRLEEIAETAAAEVLLEAEALATKPAGAEIRRRPEILARAVALRLELVVGRALFLVAQHFVGLVDGLEPLLGPGFLADIRVVLARQPAVGGLDFRLAGRRLDAEGVVVVLELHGLALEREDPRGPRVQFTQAGASGLKPLPHRGITTPGCGAGWSRAAWEWRSRARRACRWRSRPRDWRCRAARSAGRTRRGRARRASSARIR